MRFWLREDERKPDPAPVATDDRRAVVVGLALWVVALLLLLVFGGPLRAVGFGWLIWMAVIGCALGVLGLVILQFKRR